MIMTADRGVLFVTTRKLAFKEGLFSLTFTNFKVDSPGIMNSEFLKTSESRFSFLVQQYLVVLRD